MNFLFLKRKRLLSLLLLMPLLPYAQTQYLKKIREYDLGQPLEQIESHNYKVISKSKDGDLYYWKDLLVSNYKNIHIGVNATGGRIVGVAKKELVFWDLLNKNTFKKKFFKPKSVNHFKYLRFSTDGGDIATISDEDGSFYLWQAKSSGGNMTNPKKIGTKFTQLNVLDFHPYKKVIACGGNSKFLHIINLEDRKKDQIIRLNATAKRIRYSLNATYLSVLLSNGKLVVWKIKDQKYQIYKILSLKAGEKTTAMEFHPNNLYILSVTNRGRIVVWMLNQGIEYCSLKVDDRPMTNLDYRVTHLSHKAL